MNYFITCLKKYAVFRGRASRKEFWTFYLTVLAIVLLLSILDTTIGMTQDDVGFLTGLFALAVTLPIYAALVRRYHDSGHSGWWIFVPIFSFILLFYRSQPGDNKYGPNPLQAK